MSKKLISFLVLFSFVFTTVGPSYVLALRAPAGMSTVESPSLPAPSSENISSGNWSAEWHDELNEQIRELIGTKDDVTDKYNQKKLKEGLEKVIANFVSLIPDTLKQEIANRSKSVEPSLTLDLLLERMEQLIDNPQFKLFFLQPNYGEDVFKQLVKKDGQSLVLTAEAHFGHHQTAGAAREENIYLASPYFDSLTPAGKLGLISHDLVHLVLGKGDNVHRLADLVQNSISYAYDNQHYNLSQVRKNLRDYLDLKDGLIEALKKEEREKALEKYNQWQALIKETGKVDTSLDTLTMLIFEELKEKTGPVLAKIMSEIGLAKGNVNARGMIMDTLLGQAKIGYSLANLIFDTINKFPKKDRFTDEDLKKAMFIVSSLLAQEIKTISQPRHPEFMNDLVDEVIKEVVEALYDEEPARKHWERRLKADISAYSLENLIPEKYFKEGLFAEKKDYILGTIAALNQTLLSAGSSLPELNKVFLTPNWNRMRVRVTLLHELIHHLAQNGQIKIDPSWEFTTYSIDLCVKIMRARNGNIGTAEKEMEIFTEYFPGFKELYWRGKEIVQKGESVYRLKPGQTAAQSGYFSIDLMVIEAIKVYEKQGLPTDSLRRYLANKNKRLVTLFEEEQFYRDQYFSQMAAGLILAGIFIDDYEQNKIHPLRSLRDYFSELDRVFGPPSNEDQPWIENELIPELQTLAQQLFGRQTVLAKSAVTDRLGLWWCEGGKWEAAIHYWPFTIYPKAKDDPNRAPHRQKARERGIGNLLLALYRFMYGRDKDLEKNNPDWFTKPEFSILWDSLLIPRSIFSAVPLTQKKVKSDQALGMYLEIPRMIGDVFKEKYNLGNPKIEKEYFNSYPLHLQFLDSLLYRWSQYDSNKGLLADPRAAPQGLIDEAVRKTTAGWLKVMFQADQYSNYPGILKIISEEIWPVYQELWEKDKEIELNRRLIQKLEEEEKIKAEEFDPANLTAEQEKFLEDLFNSLPQNIREQITEQIEDRLNSASSNSGQKGMSLPGKEQGKPSKLPPPVPSEKPTLGNLESSLETIEQTLTEISEKAKDIGKGSERVKKEIPATGGELAKGKKIEKIDADTGKLQEQAADLGQKGEQITKQSEGIKNEVIDSVNNLPVPEAGKEAAEKACQSSAEAGQVNQKIKELQEKVNRLKKLTERLQETKDKGGDPSQLGQLGEAIKEQANDICKTCAEIGKETANTAGSLQPLKEALDKLSEEVKELFAKDIVPPRSTAGEKTAGEKEKAAQGLPQEGIPASASAEKEAASTGLAEETPRSDSRRLPAGSDLSSLKNIIQKADEVPSLLLKDKYAGEEFNTVVDQKWLEALKKQELLAECERTGLNEQELKEYKEWLGLLDKDLLEKMTEVVKGLLRIETDIEKFPARYSGILKKVVKGILGGEAFVKRQETKPVPVKLSLLIDKSGSMSGERILSAKLTMFLLLEVIFAVNDELQRKGWPVIEFEVGCFNHDSDLFISHQTSAQIGEDRKERLIYDALKKLEATGNTDLKKALGEFVTRLAESPEATGTEGKAQRILFSIGDGDVNKEEKKEIRQVLSSAEENSVEVFGVSVGDKEAMQSVLNAFGEKRAILPQKPDLSDLPQLVVRKFAECLAPPDTKISWEDILSRLMIIPGLLGLRTIVSSFFYLQGIYFRHSSPSLQISEPVIRPTGYQHFFYQERNGKDYLVWKRPGAEELSWQRGLGGANVPQTITIDDDDNEQLILKILEALYIPNVEYTSFSLDGKYYLKKGEKNKIFLMERKDPAEWKIKKTFTLLKDVPTGKEEAGFKLFKKGDLEWRLDALKNLYLPGGEKNWLPVIGHNGGFSEHLEIEYDAEQGWYRIFDSANPRVVMVKKPAFSEELEVVYDLQLEKFSRAEDWEGRIVRLVGELSLGKDELIRAVMHLMNMDTYFIAGSEDLEPEDLDRIQTLGIEEGISSGELYTPLNKVSHSGGTAVIDEGDELKPSAKGSLKTPIAGKSHQREVKNDSGGKELTTFSNHPLARVVMTTNLFRRGTEGKGPSDQATQRRFKDVLFVWRTPTSEKHLQYELALRKLKKLRPDLAEDSAEFRQELERIKNIVELLVDIAWPMRLTFAGYDAAQQAMLVKDNFKNWKELLEDPAFVPRSDPGKNLRRAPSPRVIRNIVEHSIMFPKTWENAPLKTALVWFNLWADDLKPLEKERQMQAVKTQFENPPKRGGAGLKDKDNLPPLILTPDSFKLDGEYLIVTPQKAEIEGQLLDFWDPINIWIHPDARDYFSHFGVPDGVKYWLSTGDPENSELLYLGLQLRALGKSPIFVGEQGAGKSVLAKTIAELLDGEEVPQIEVKPTTDKEELTFKHSLEGGKSRFNPGPIPVGARDKKTVIVEEPTQGKPGVMAVTSEAIERQFITHPDGTKWGEEGDGRFGLIATANPPGSGDFYVKPFGDKLLDRQPVVLFKILAPEKMFDFILPITNRGNLGVNHRLIGEKRMDSNGNIVKLPNGEDKWDGLLGAVQDLMLKKKKNPLDKNLPPRIPDLGMLYSLVKEIRDYWGKEELFNPGKKQDILLKKFLNNFVLEGTIQQKAKWAESIKEAFKQARLWSDQKDGLEEYLAGEDVIVQKLPLLRKPDSKDYRVDQMLIYLQENTRGVSVENKIAELEQILVGLKDGWEELSFYERLQRMHVLREVWQILELICIKRKGRAYDCHTDLNIEKLQSVQQTIQTQVLVQDWPPSFMEREETWEQLKEKWANLPPTGDLSIDDLIGKTAVNLEKEEYVDKQLEKITTITAPWLNQLPEMGKQLHENLGKAHILVQIKTALDKIYEKNQAATGLKKLTETIETGLAETGWGFVDKDLGKLEDAPLWKKYLQVLQKGVKATKKEEIEQAQKEAEEIFEEAKAKELNIPTLEKGGEGGFETTGQADPNEDFEYAKEVVESLSFKKDKWLYGIKVIKEKNIKNDLDFSSYPDKPNELWCEFRVDDSCSGVELLEKVLKSSVWEKVPIRGSAWIFPSEAKQKIEAALDELKRRQAARGAADLKPKITIVGKKGEDSKINKDVLDKLGFKVSGKQNNVIAYTHPNYPELKFYWNEQSGIFQADLSKKWYKDIRDIKRGEPLLRDCKPYGVEIEEIIKIAIKNNDQDSEQLYFVYNFNKAKKVPTPPKIWVFNETYSCWFIGKDEAKVVKIIKNLENQGIKFETDSKPGTGLGSLRKEIQGFAIYYDPLYERNSITMYFGKTKDRSNILSDFQLNLDFDSSKTNLLKIYLIKTGSSVSKTFKGMALVDIIIDEKVNKITIVVKDEFLPFFEELDIKKSAEKFDGYYSYEFIGETEAKQKFPINVVRDFDLAEAGNGHDRSLPLSNIFAILWGIQTTRSPQPMVGRLNQLDSILPDLMKNWEGNYYDLLYPFVQHLIWIKKYLSEIKASLNDDNAYLTDECKETIQKRINTIEEQFKNHPWPEKCKLPVKNIPLIGGAKIISPVPPLKKGGRGDLQFSAVPGLKLRQIGNEFLAIGKLANLVSDEDGYRFFGTDKGISYTNPKADIFSTIKGTENLDCQWIDLDKGDNLYVLTTENKLYFIPKNQQGEYEFSGKEIKLPKVGQVELNLIPIKSFKISDDGKYIYINVRVRGGWILRFNLKKEKDAVIIDEKTMKKNTFSFEQGQTMEIVGDNWYLSGMHYTGIGQATCNGIRKLKFDAPDKAEFIDKIKGKDVSGLGATLYLTKTVEDIIYVTDSEDGRIYRLDTKADKLELEMVKDINGQDNLPLADDDGRIFSFTAGNLSFRIDKDTQKPVLGIFDSEDKCLREFVFLDENDQPIAAVPQKPVQLSTQSPAKEQVASRLMKKIESVNLSQLWSAYYAAVANNQKDDIPNAYNSLIFGIQAANSLEFVRPLQEFYLYLMSLVSDPLSQKLEVQKTAEIIRQQLESLKTEIKEKIETVLEDDIDSPEKAVIVNLQEEIEQLAMLDKVLAEPFSSGGKTKKPVTVGLYFGLPIQPEIIDEVSRKFVGLLSEYFLTLFSVFSPAVITAKLAFYSSEWSRPFTTPAIQNHMAPVLNIPKENPLRSLQKAA